MPPEQKRVLWVLVGAFGILASVYTWGLGYDAFSRFRIGIDTTLPTEQAPTPTLPPPLPSDPSRGASPLDATVTITTFASYDCPSCRSNELILNRALTNTSAKVRLIWKDLPDASERPESMIAVLASRCAADQGLYWPMHDALLTLPSLDMDSISAAARAAHINKQPFDTCLVGNKHLPEVQQELETAKQHNIVTTPTTFVGNNVFTGPLNERDLTLAFLRASLLKK